MWWFGLLLGQNKTFDDMTLGYRKLYIFLLFSDVAKTIYNWQIIDYEKKCFSRVVHETQSWCINWKYTECVHQVANDPVTVSENMVTDVLS